ncbi:hypothetical protein LJR029_002327 [Caballeronia sp. LjRoot29]|jgi:heme/copper-type cytochrome/quinol oxidase subunit 2|uniref:hypothetical protein n=1 Tax=Caballeronia sp. LjRoot29 TaxID=3342315 RepID=UPI003ECF5A52
MDIKRLTDWITGAEGLGAKLTSLCLMSMTIWLPVGNKRKLVLSNWAITAIAIGVAGFLIVSLWVSFRRFARELA